MTTEVLTLRRWDRPRQEFEFRVHFFFLPGHPGESSFPRRYGVVTRGFWCTETQPFPRWPPVMPGGILSWWAATVRELEGLGVWAYYGVFNPKSLPEGGHEGSRDTALLLDMVREVLEQTVLQDANWIRTDNSTPNALAAYSYIMNNPAPSTVTPEETIDGIVDEIMRGISTDPFLNDLMWRSMQPEYITSPEMTQALARQDLLQRALYGIDEKSEEAQRPPSRSKALELDDLKKVT